MKRLFTSIFAALAVLFAGTAAHAVVLYSQTFESDDTANWTVNMGPATTDEAHDFYFDYNTVGIPPAPGSSGTTRGLKLQANQSSGVFGGVSVSPIGLSLPKAYTLTFDWWTNFNGPAPGGGNGSTQLSTFGVGTSGTVAQWPGGSQDSIWFGGTTDGNSSADWRAYSPNLAGVTSYTAASGVYAAGTSTNPDARNHNHPYYESFGNLSPPAAQLALFPQQTGTSLVGSAPFEWHQVEITKNLTSVTWTVDGLLIATIPTEHDSVDTGENIFFGHSDTNATSSTDPNDVNLLFTLIDNVNVSVIPEPASLSLIGLCVGLMCVGRRVR